MINEIQKLYNANYKVEFPENLQNELEVIIEGSKDSLYKGYQYKIKIYIPYKCPYKSSSIRFVTRIFHPNIDEKSGTICLDVFNQVWSPMFDLLNVVDIFIPQLLIYPNLKDPLNCQAAMLHLNNYEDYTKKVEEYKVIYAIFLVQEHPVGDIEISNNLSDSFDL